MLIGIISDRSYWLLARICQGNPDAVAAIISD